jgi:hypothetical protein
MLDDDGTPYYYGRSSLIDFGPLDDFGGPNAGCSTIEYLNQHGDWEML